MRTTNTTYHHLMSIKEEVLDEILPFASTSRTIAECALDTFISKMGIKIENDPEKEPLYQGIPNPIIENMKNENVTVVFNKRKNFKITRNNNYYLKGCIEDFGSSFNVRWSFGSPVPQHYTTFVANAYRMHKRKIENKE